MEKDWRFDFGKHLANTTFEFKTYKPVEANNEHDHCEFCSKKFSETISESEHEGYLAMSYDKKGRGQGHWICKECFDDFKDSLNLKVK